MESRWAASKRLERESAWNPPQDFAETRLWFPRFGSTPRGSPWGSGSKDAKEAPLLRTLVGTLVLFLLSSLAAPVLARNLSAVLTPARLKVWSGPLVAMGVLIDLGFLYLAKRSVENVQEAWAGK